MMTMMVWQKRFGAGRRVSGIPRFFFGKGIRPKNQLMENRSGLRYHRRVETDLTRTLRYKSPMKAMGHR